VTALPIILRGSDQNQLSIPLKKGSFGEVSASSQEEPEEN